MKPRIKGSWTAGLIAITAMLMIDQVAMAGGIIINQANSTPVGDPIYEYYLQISIVATAAQPLLTGGYITISGFVDLASFAGAAEPNDWSSSNLTSTSLRFTYLGSEVDTTINYPLGAFRYGPTIELNTPPTPTLTYTGYLDPNGPASNSGTIVVTYVAPEPSSAVLLFAGLGAVVPLFLVYRKRRQAIRA